MPTKLPTKTDNQASPLYHRQKTDAVNVAVAIIHYRDQYLLGFRHAAQHQGQRYEFVGGKIDAGEEATQALTREVAEETGIDISHRTPIKLGRLYHDYGDKRVVLQVYKIELTAEQYEQHKYCQRGLEGQLLRWVHKSELLAGAYSLPAANKTILAWLGLPSAITITYPLAYFGEGSDQAAKWQHYHRTHLPSAAWVYCRTKTSDPDDSVRLAMQLSALRSDICLIVAEAKEAALIKACGACPQVVAHHLTHGALMQRLALVQNAPAVAAGGSMHLPLIISCHDAASIEAANQLASMRIQQQQPPVLGIFISPVLATQTHPDTEPLGWEAWSDLAQLADMPVIALGGLSPDMIDQALTCGGISVAGIRQFFSHDDKDG